MGEVTSNVALERRCLRLVSITELEVLQERILQELVEVTRAQSGALWVANEKGLLRLRVFRGLFDRQSLPASMDGSLIARTPWENEQGLWVPLTVGEQLWGLAQLGHPLSKNFGDAMLGPVEVLSGFGGAALQAAHKLLALQRQGLRDRESGAYTLSYFTDYATKEIYKARRYSRAFSILTFSIDNLSQIRLRLGAPTARSVQQATLKVIAQSIRDSDVIARATDQEFYVLLPETEFFGALMFLRRALSLVRNEAAVRAVEWRLPLGLTGGAATFPRDGEDFDELLGRCRQRMNERRRSLQQLLNLETPSFWESVELLLGNSRSPRLPDPGGEPSRRGRVADTLLQELQGELARELLRDPTARGLLYLGGREVRSDLPLLMGLEGAPAGFGTNIFVLGKRADVETHPVATPVFVEGDAELDRHDFLLWLGDAAAYALLQRRGRTATWGFHTADPALIEGLVSKLQAQYDLQAW